MAQTQFRSDDTTLWGQGYGNGNLGVGSINTSTDTPTKTTLTGSLGAFTGVVGSNSGFAVGDIVIIHQTQGTGTSTWQFNYIVSIAATTFTFVYPLVVTFGTGCQIQKAYQYSNLTINGGQTLTQSLWGGTTGGIYCAFVNGTTTITGTITVNGADASGASLGSGGGFRGGIGRKPFNSTGDSGEGTIGASVQQTAANGNGGGAGSGDDCSGAGGGNGTAGANGNKRGTGAGAAGTGGNSIGSADLTTMNFGGGGGGAAEFDNAQNALAGGNGGGMTIIVTSNLTITGAITSNGGAGGNGAAGDESGGGGAGGSVLFKCKTATLGSNLITVAAGAGGSSGNNGGAGGVGRIHIDYSRSFTGTATPTIDSRQDRSLESDFQGFVI